LALNYEALLESDSFEDLPGKWQPRFWRPRTTGRICEVVGRD
jgi:hypothetical protein